VNREKIPIFRLIFYVQYRFQVYSNVKDEFFDYCQNVDYVGAILGNQTFTWTDL